MKLDLLQKAYDPNRFREEGHRVIDILADYLQSTLDASLPMTPYSTPEAQYHFWNNHLDTFNGSTHELLRTILDHSLKIHHRHYMGHQVAVPAPDTALTALLTNLINNVAVVYEMGPAAVAIERVVLRWIAGRMGFDDQAEGVMTSGGTLANLTALLTMRSVKCPNDVWSEGYGSTQYAVMVSEESHYSVDKAIRVMGWGERGIIKVPVGSDYKMRTDLLPDLLQKAKDEGVVVVGVIGCSCSTSTGIYDSLEPIADFCEQNDLWFHVDGAHGGPAIFSERYRSYLKGVDRADSVVMDFHKMMMTPALATAVLFRRGGDSYQTFAQKAQYLWEESKDHEWYNIGQRSYECTKLMMGVKVFTLLSVHGESLFCEYVERTYDMGQLFASMIDASPVMELAIVPETNVVCFRYKPIDVLTDSQLSQLNARIRQEMLEESNFYILQTRLKGEVYLRITVMNPFTTESDLRIMMDSCIAVGSRLIGSI